MVVKVVNFFSHDYKYVLKTINKLEYNFIISNLEQFYDYYENNPNSLLAKIYGLYTIKGEQIDVAYDMILMKNIFGCQKKQIIRTYDLKGSKYHRQVIQAQKGMCNQLQSITLKDTNFINLQGKIHIQPKYINQLRDMIKKDTMFLKNFNLIDYSLLLVRVKWDKQPENKRFWNRLQRIESVKQKGEYYHIGIIDYMQAWNMSKKSQNWFKRLIGKKQISAQQPNFYQKRFIEFVDSITHTQQYEKYALLRQSKKNEHQQQHKSQQLSTSRTKFINIQQQLQKINKKYSQSIISIENNSHLGLNTSNNLSQFNVSSPDHMIMMRIYQDNNSKQDDLNFTIVKNEERKYSEGFNGFNKNNNDQMEQNQSVYHDCIDENDKSKQS